jgi:hypothetical protein
MRDHYLGSGETRQDWDARFRSWCRDEARRDAQRRQSNVTISIPGKPDTTAWKTEWAREIQAKREARKVRDDPDDGGGPIIEGMVG